MSGIPGKTWSFILVAAGSGTRMKGRGPDALPKQFQILGNLPLWEWPARVAEALCLEGQIDELIVLFPLSYMDRLECSDKPNFQCNVKFIAGGASRAESVRLGLDAASSDFVLVHDAARPFLTREICLELMELTDEKRGAIPLLSSVDSLKVVDGESISAADRGKIFRTQTPQAFHRTRLIEAIDSYDGDPTDEASAWLAASHPLARMDGEAANFKITNNYDWNMARSLVEGVREVRTGFGYDVHELVPERTLVLGGVKLISPLGLLGHSDADIICHSISDALLGAAGVGDIGTLFPASDEKYRNADSTILLEDVLRRIAEEGWRIAWIDVVLAAQLPRLAAEMTKISDNLRSLFTRNGQEDKLSLKVKSGEFIGSVGRAECMTCYAAATIERFMLK